MKNITIVLALVLAAVPLQAMDAIPSLKVLNQQYNTISESKLRNFNQEFYMAVKDRIVTAYEGEENDLTLEFFTNENNHIFYFPDVIKVNETLIDLLKRHLQNKGYIVEKKVEDNEISLLVFFGKKKV